MQIYATLPKSELAIIPRFSMPTKGISLDTLAQPTQSPHEKGVQTLTSRALSKVITDKYLYSLIDLKNERENSYWDTWHCVRSLYQSEDGKITSKYCNRRWCMVCNRIRTGKMINGYSPVIEKWNDLRFLTLTRPNVFNGLRDEFGKMQSGWKRVLQRLRRRGYECKGIRKVEITWKKHSGYNIHYHVLTDGEDVGNGLTNEWLMENSNAKSIGQDHRKGDVKTVKEMFKYMTKLWKTVKGEDGDVKYTLPYPPIVLDSIFACMYGKRTVQAFGGVKRVSEDVEDLDSTVRLDEARNIEWDWDMVGTWVDKKTGELRTKAQEPDGGLEKIRVKPPPYGTALKKKIKEVGEVKKFA